MTDSGQSRAGSGGDIAADGRGLTMDDLEGRLTAHRRVLQWLLQRHAASDPRALQDLLSGMEDNFPPLDHQEDPGAVPTGAFGAFAAYSAEMRLLLADLRDGAA